MRLDRFTLCIPFYSQQYMLECQFENLLSYPRDVRERIDVIVIDDCSPERAATVVTPDDGVALYRIVDDIPWNRSGARNLAAHVCETDWLVHVDTDHVLPPDAAEAMFEAEVDPDSWYRFPRFRVGKADETRRKDVIGDEVEYGAIKPHIDSYLCTTDMYWAAGGYNEDFSGCLGGGSPFLAELTKVGGEPKLLPEPVCLHVYTRDVIPDASVFTLSRDTSEYRRRRKALRESGTIKGHDPLRFEWERLM